MSGLFSSLALSTSVATSILMGVQPPEAPDIPDQVTTQHSRTADVHDASGSKTVKRPQSPDEVPSLLEDASELLTGDSSTLSDVLLPTGVDVSSHQHTEKSKINIDKIVSGGQQFAFIKATEGTGYINPHFRSDVVSFVKNSTPIGFYHYAKPTDDPEEAKEQAQHFVTITGIDKGVKSLAPVLDIEETNGVDDPEDLARWTKGFVDEVKALTGKDVMIYTYPEFWKNEMGNTEEFNHLPLWIADYNHSSTPTTPLPGGWDDWDFWQYTSEGNIEGSPEGIDVNFFNGRLAEIRDTYEDSAKDSTSKSSQTKTVVTKTVTAAPEAPTLDTD